MVSSSVIVVGDNGEVASNINQDDTLSRGDASVVVTADIQNVSQDISDETSLAYSRQLHIVENTPPQSRKFKRHVVLGVWRDVKRLKGLGAHRPDLSCRFHLCLPSGPTEYMGSHATSYLTYIYKGKLLGNGSGTGSWINTKAEKHIASKHHDHCCVAIKAQRNEIAHDAKVILMLQQPTLCIDPSSYIIFKCVNAYYDSMLFSWV
jgi:hypothetical protein